MAVGVTTHGSHRSVRARIRATVPLTLDSPYKKRLHARAAILGRYGDTWYRVRSLGRSSRPRFQCQTPPYGFPFPPPGSSGTSSPASSVLSKRYDALPPSRRTSFPSLGGTSVPLVVFAPKRTSEPLGLELVTRCLHPGVRRGANRILPSSWGTTIVRLHMFQSDAGRTAYTRPLRLQQRGPWSSKGKGSHERSFDAQ